MRSLNLKVRQKSASDAGSTYAISAPIAAFANEYARLIDAATIACAGSRLAAPLGITPPDIVRDVLLNCGGLGNLSSLPRDIAVCCNGSLVRLTRRRSPLQSYVDPMRGLVDLSSSTVAPVEDAVALSLHHGFHYLGSPRPGGRHLGLFAEQAHEPRALLCLATVSTFDLQHLVPRLVSTASAQSTLVLSRLLALPNAPPNAMSRLLGGVFDWIRRHEPSIEMLLTYNKPNLGFFGTVYKATNWQLIGLDRKLPDMALDGEYISLRDLKSRFGSFRFDDLRLRLNERLQLMPCPYHPLEVYVQRLRRANRCSKAKDI
jgi:hypothetical protein